MDELNNNEYNELTLEDIFRMFKKHFWLFLGIVITVVTLTAIYLVLATPIYEAAVRIQIEPTSKSSMSDLFLNQVTGSYSSKDISTEVELIKSRTNFEEVAKRLGLVDKIYDESTLEKLRIEGYTDDDLTASLVSMLSQITTVSPVKDTRIVKISIQHKNKVLAKDIANTLAEVYNEKLADLSKREIMTKKEFIQTQIPLLEDDLNKATDALKNFKEETGIYVLDEQAKWLLQMLSNYDQQYNSLTVSIEENNALRLSYQTMLKDFNSDETSEGQSKWLKTSETLSMNPILTQLKSRLASLKVERADLIEQYPLTDPKVKAKNAEILETEKMISDEVENEFIKTGESQSLNPAYSEIVSGMIMSESSQQVLEASLISVDLLRKKYQQQLASLPSNEQRLLELQRQITVKENLYTLLLERLEEAKISEAAVTGNAAVVDPATLPRGAVKPNKKLSLAIGGVLGIFLGMLIVFMAEYMDKTLKTEEEIEKFSHKTIIGRIPFIEDLKSELIVKTNPTAPSSEAMKLTASNLSYTMGDKKAVAITSVSPSEGKSFILANAAYSLALTGQKVLVLDLDMRRPRVEKVFALKRSKQGIVDVLLKNVAIKDVLINYDENIDILPVGSVPPNPTIILSSKGLKELFESVLPYYDKILIDMPPAMVTSDVSIIGNKVDGIIFVVKPGSTLKDGLRLALQNIATSRGEVLGLIINGVTERTSNYYYYYYYYSEDNKKHKGKRRKTAKV